MTFPAVSAEQHVALTQVWAHVPHDLQQRTIRLLAQLAVNWVVAQSTWTDTSPSEKEMPHARS
jgi:oligoendopeptidase F